MYTYKSRIRYSEVDSGGRLRLESLLDYFQDCSTFHSEDLGLGIEYLGKRRMAWVLTAWQIVADRYPGIGEWVTVGTAPYDFRGFLGYRNFCMDSENGEQLAWANSIWTLVNIDKMLPVRPTQEMLDGYVLSQRLPMDYTPRKISVPTEGEEREAVAVKHHHLDTNNHVNNGQYIRMAMDCIPGDCTVRQLRAEYKKPAVLGDILKPVYTQTEDGRCTVVLRREQEPCCVAELIYK